MAIIAKLYRSENNRAAARYELDRESTLRDAGGAPFDVLIEDISATGFHLQLPFALAIDQNITIGVPGIGVRQARVVRSDLQSAGCLFHNALEPGELEVVLRADESVVETLLARMLYPMDTPDNHEVQGTGIDDTRVSGPARIAIIFAAAVVGWGILGLGYVGIRALIAG